MIGLLLWFISPIILLTLLIAEQRKNSELKRQNWELTQTVNRLMNKEKEPSEDKKAPEKPIFSEPDASHNPIRESTAQLYSSADPVKSETMKKPSPTFAEPVERYAAPDSETDVQPESAAQLYQTPKKSVSTLNIILILGALLLSLSGFIFAIAAWGRLNMFLKSAVLASFSALFFGIHSLTERKLKLPQTGRIFYILGSIFLPSAVVAAGILKVFGEYFSFYGGGRAAVLSAVFLSICIPFFKGAHDYKNRFFSAVFCYSFSASLVSAIWQLSPGGSVTSLLTAVFALLVVLLEPTVQGLFKRFFGDENVFAAEWNRFSVVNAWILSAVSLLTANEGFVSLTAFALFSLCFLTKTVTDKSGTAGAVGFAFFIASAMFSGFSPDGLSDFTCITAATALICAVLSVMGIFPESLKKAMNILGIFVAGLTGLCGIIENAELFQESAAPSVQLIIAAASVYAQFLVFALRYGKTAYKAASFGAMLWLTADVFLLIFGGTVNEIFAYILSFCIMLVYFAVVRFTLKIKLYTAANDIILGMYGLICSILCIVDGTLWGSAILLSAAGILMLSRQKGISAVMCPALIVMTVFPLFQYFRDPVSIAIAYGLLLLYFFAARFTKMRRELYNPLLDIFVGVIAFFSAIVCCGAFNANSGVVWGFVILAAGIIAAAFSNQKSISPKVCVLLTFSTFFPTGRVLYINKVFSVWKYTVSNTFAITMLTVCIAAAILLFFKKCDSYARSYSHGVAASVPIFTIVSILCNTPNFVPILAATAYAALYLFKSAFPKEKFAGVNYLNGMIILSAAFIGVYLDKTVFIFDKYYWPCLPTAAGLIIFAVMVTGKIFGRFEKTSPYTEHFLWYAMPALSGITIFWGYNGYIPVLTILGIISGLCTVYLSVCRKNAMTVIFPIVTELFVLSDDHDAVVLAAILAIVFGIAGRFIFRKKIFDKVFTDVFSIAAFPSAIMMYANSKTDVWRWFALLLFGMLTANLIRREQTEKTNSTILTIALAFIFPLWWSEPFFTVPKLIEVQFNLLPLWIFCVILRFIWRNAETVVYNISFGAAILSLVVLFINALSSKEVFDAVFIGIVIMTMLGVSFIIKRKRWFVLAVASMVTSAVLLSISQRDSIAWLVYLAVAGAALIALGVVNELKKQQKKSGEDGKLTRFMSDWTW